MHIITILIPSLLTLLTAAAPTTTLPKPDACGPTVQEPTDPPDTCNCAHQQTQHLFHSPRPQGQVVKFQARLEHLTPHHQRHILGPGHRREGRLAIEHHIRKRRYLLGRLPD